MNANFIVQLIALCVQPANILHLLGQQLFRLADLGCVVAPETALVAALLAWTCGEAPLLVTTSLLALVDEGWDGVALAVWGPA